MNAAPRSPKETIPLNSAQQAAVDAHAGPLLIVAGAGTGKTRTLTSRILSFIELGVPPERICAITFTNKAANEMAERVARGLTGIAGPQIAGRKPYIGTFHSLGARILRRECAAMGRKPNFTIFDDHDSFDVLKKVLKLVAAPGKKEKKEGQALFMTHISRLKNVGAASALSPKLDAREAAGVFDGYESALKENNAFDFDDLIEKVVAIFRARPGVLQKYQNMFDAMLIDEYQDINPKQHEFIKLLAGRHKNLSVVGDDEQTIYGWRYADISIFLNFEREWPGAQIHFLEENYRSTCAIISSASAVVRNNLVRAPKNLYTNNPKGEPITLFEADNENFEAEWIAYEIQNIGEKNLEKLTEGRTPSSAGGGSASGGSSPLEKGEDGTSIAILYRTNAQSRAIEQSLIRRDIPYRIFGGLKFYERREVKDVVAGLRYSANMSDTVSRERLEKNLTKRKFAAFKAKLHAAKDPNPKDIIGMFLEVFNYIEYLEENFVNADERQENVVELVNFVSGFDDVNELLEKLSLLQSTDDEQANGARRTDDGSVVTMMTIHMAKGLEFDTVFIAGVSEGLLPHARSIGKEASLEEERRLMYVAMTRARKKLYISFYGMPSRFVSEIPEEFLELRTVSDNTSGFGVGGSYKEDNEDFIELD
jgi:DNA helicase-2/ATP-dependent DNA helicase PcrA